MCKKILFIAGMMVCCTWTSAQEISRTWGADKVLDTAGSLATLFNPVVGTILFWHGK